MPCGHRRHSAWSVFLCPSHSLLLEVFAHLFRSKEVPGIDVCRSTINFSKALRGEQVIKIWSFPAFIFHKVVYKDVGHIFVDC